MNFTIISDELDLYVIQSKNKNDVAYLTFDHQPKLADYIDVEGHLKPLQLNYIQDYNFDLETRETFLNHLVEELIKLGVPASRSNYDPLNVTLPHTVSEEHAQITCVSDVDAQFFIKYLLGYEPSTTEINHYDPKSSGMTVIYGEGGRLIWLLGEEETSGYSVPLNQRTMTVLVSLKQAGWLEDIKDAKTNERRTRVVAMLSSLPNIVHGVTKLAKGKTLELLGTLSSVKTHAVKDSVILSVITDRVNVEYQVSPTDYQIVVARKDLIEKEAESLGYRPIPTQVGLEIDEPDFLTHVRELYSPDGQCDCPGCKLKKPLVLSFGPKTVTYSPEEDSVVVKEEGMDTVEYDRNMFLYKLLKRSDLANDLADYPEPYEKLTFRLVEVLAFSQKSGMSIIEKALADILRSEPESSTLH